MRQIRYSEIPVIHLDLEFSKRFFYNEEADYEYFSYKQYQYFMYSENMSSALKSHMRM